MKLSKAAYVGMWRIERLPPRQGRLVVFCGPDGVGKTTQIALLDRYLRDEKQSTAITKQPSDWYRSNPIFRNYAVEGTKVDQLFLALLAAADRRLHVTEVIDPGLSARRWVISDRYVYSSLAYFAERGIDPNIVAQFNIDVPRPDLTVFLDVPGTVLFDRIETRDGNSRNYEERHIDKLERLAANFRSIASMDSSILVLDGCQEELSIHRMVVDRLHVRPEKS